MITTRTIKKSLAGESFEVVNESSGEVVSFSFPSSFDSWPPRSGSEGIVAPVTCHHPKHGDIPSIIKFFNFVIPDRSTRQSHLVRKGLAGAHDWLYDGVPYCWIDKVVNGERLYGHVSKHVFYDNEGDDFRIIRDKPQMDSFTDDERREMASQLCNAIVGLEKKGLVHTDLSPANIIIGRDNNGRAKCILIDYDGFNSPNIPMLPIKHNDNAIRLLGSRGYQHPSLINKISAAKEENLVVENDRFSLAVLCYEIMVWTSDMSDNLKRTHLLDISDLEKAVLNIPAGIKNKWSKGYSLLKKAVVEQNVNKLPSPEEWLKALGFLGSSWEGSKVDWSTNVALSIYKQHGNMRKEFFKKASFEKNSGDNGNFSILVNELQGLSYEYDNSPTGHCLSFKIIPESKLHLIIKRGGKTKFLKDFDNPIDINPDDQVTYNGWILYFYDNSVNTTT